MFRSTIQACGGALIWPTGKITAMLRYTTLVATALTALILFGCTAQKPPLRRYVIVNKSNATITNLIFSIGNRYEKNVERTWKETLPDQGWVYSARHHGCLIVSWRDSTGDNEEMLFPLQNTLFQSKNNLYIELNNGSLTSRTIEPPPEERNWSASVAIFLLYCLFISLLFGVPIGLTLVVVYVLFQFLRAMLVAIFEGLHGDKSLWQFTIREVALLTVAVAFACGWYIQFLAMKH